MERRSPLMLSLSLKSGVLVFVYNFQGSALSFLLIITCKYNQFNEFIDIYIHTLKQI